MEVFTYDLIENENVEDKNARGTKVRWLISKERGATNYEMRLFEVEKDGYTPFHTHNWEHEVFVLEGNGIVKSKNMEICIKKGSVVFIKSNELHQFINKGDRVLKFICVIPVRA